MEFGGGFELFQGPLAILAFQLDLPGAPLNFPARERSREKTKERERQKSKALTTEKERQRDRKREGEIIKRLPRKP